MAGVGRKTDHVLAANSLDRQPTRWMTSDAILARIDQRHLKLARKQATVNPSQRQH
jgi:hypothetical protein